MLVGAATMVWPLAVIAQSTDRMRRIGVLTALAEDDPGWRRNFAGFVAGLRDAGWVEGRNYHFESRYVPGGGEPDNFRVAARELVALAPDVILSVPWTAALAVAHETRTAPIVFLLSTDPVREGLVTNIAHPEGNATGFTQSEPTLGGKWLQLLKEIAPDTTRALVVFGPTLMAATNPVSRLYAQSIDEAASTNSVAVNRALVQNDGEIENVLTGFAQRPNGGLIIPPDSFTSAHRVQIIALAARLRLPAVYFARFCATDGGLLSYGIDQPDLFRQGGGYIDRILRGTKPGDLPVQAPKKFELVINLNTAKALGITIPPALLARADEVIE